MSIQIEELLSRLLQCKNGPSCRPLISRIPPNGRNIRRRRKPKCTPTIQSHQRLLIKYTHKLACILSILSTNTNPLIIGQIAPKIIHLHKQSLLKPENGWALLLKHNWDAHFPNIPSIASPTIGSSYPYIKRNNLHLIGTKRITSRLSS